MYRRNRSNIPSSSTEEYYKITIFIPHLDDLVSSLNNRFISHKDTIISLQCILSFFSVNKPFPSIEAAVHFYLDDLPGLKNSINS